MKPGYVIFELLALDLTMKILLRMVDFHGNLIP